MEIFQVLFHMFPKSSSVDFLYVRKGLQGLCNDTSDLLEILTSQSIPQIVESHYLHLKRICFDQTGNRTRGESSRGGQVFDLHAELLYSNVELSWRAVLGF